ncbi:hypothetical protein RB195_021199 [Necator americanus]|uniref:Uncharacterized protein n=1 Tax=Necator americanus TaxID=51031 RepID=A0ABR1EAI3_NECAM
MLFLIFLIYEEPIDRRIYVSEALFKSVFPEPWIQSFFCTIVALILASLFIQSVGCRTQAPADSSPVSIRSRPPCWAQCEELKRMDHEFVDVVLTSMDFLPPTLMILLHSTAQYSTAAQYTCLIARLIETILCPTKYPGEISSRFLRGKFYHDDVMVE